MAEITSLSSRKSLSKKKEVKPASDQERSYYEEYCSIHFEIYRIYPNEQDWYFDSEFKKVIKLIGSDLNKDEIINCIRSFLEQNRRENSEPYNTSCSVKAMTSEYALNRIWPSIKLEVKPLPVLAKKAEKPTREYYGIEEHFGFIILNDGLSNNKILKADCHEIKKDGESFFYPKDNRTKSLYDYDGLMEFLGVKKPHDFGELPYINEDPCYGFYVCSSYPKSCSYKCGKFKKLKYLFRASEIPKDYLEPMPFTESPDLKNSTDLKTACLLEIRDNIVFYVESGFNAVFYSKQTGTGKTSWACTIAKHFIFRRMMKNMLEPEAFYLNTAEYFSLIKSSMNLKDEAIHIEIAQLNNLIKDVPLLVIDDIGAEKPSEFVRERLYQIINYRSSNKKSTIYTTNLDFNSNEAVDILGSRIVSRLRSATIIDFDREEN